MKTPESNLRQHDKEYLEKNILKLIKEFQATYPSHQVHVLSVTHNSDDTFVDIILKRKP